MYWLEGMEAVIFLVTSRETKEQKASDFLLVKKRLYCDGDKS